VDVMRVELKGLASATKKLASGTSRTYYYAWRGGPMLKAPDGTPLNPKDPRFQVAFVEAHRARKAPSQGTMFTLVAFFRQSAEYRTEIGDKTRASYNRYLKMIEAEFGDLPLRALENPKARGEFNNGGTA
jgi:hypothetical protein